MDLPHPDRPSRATISPVLRPMETLSSTGLRLSPDPVVKDLAHFIDVQQRRDRRVQHRQSSSIKAMMSETQPPLRIGIELSPEQAIEQRDEDRHHRHAEHDFWEVTLVGRLGDIGADALSFDRVVLPLAPGFRLAAVGINGMTKIFAEEVRGTDVLVNSVDPGWVRTHTADATRSIEEGVATTVWLATLPKGGPSGQFFRDKQPLPW